MRIFLTGGTGFVGSIVARRLVEKGHAVYALVRNDGFTENRVDGLNYMPGDLLEAQLLKNYMKQILPDVVVHLAAFTPVRLSFDGSGAEKMANINYHGTMNVVEAAVATGGVKRIVYASTAEVYGPYPKEGRVTEETNPAPTSPYAISKLAGEHYVRYATYRGIPSVVLRATNTYGRPANLPDEARGYFVEKAVLGMLEKPRRLLSFDGSGASTRRFMHATDHASAYIAAIENAARLGDQVFNVAPSERAVTLYEVVELLKAMTDFHGEVVWERRPRPLDPNHIDIDPRKFTSTLAWKAKVPLKTGLAMTVAYWTKRLEEMKAA